MNKLFYGDNLTVMREMENESVDLIYLDPPFNSKRNYNVIFRDAKDHESLDQKTVFKDTWSNVNVPDMLFEIAKRNDKLHTFLKTLNELNLDNSTVGYLTTMSIRLIEMHRILKSTGSIYLHCDPTMSHYLKIVMDMIYSGKNFRNEIIWFYHTGGASKKHYSKKHDVILFYTKTNKYNFYPKRILDKRTEKSLKRAKTPKGARINIEDTEKLPIDVFLIQALNPMAKERLRYPTQKPLALLKRIIKASTNKGDVVFDPFCGCGTTIDASEELKRKWIGIDITPLAISLIKKRLRDQHKKSLTPYEVHGFPTTIDSARQLAKDNKFEFQDWVIEYFFEGVSNPKKVGDTGFDGYSFFKLEKETIKVIYEVKSGKISKPMLSYFNDAINNQKAGIGIFVTLEKPTSGMIEYANNCGYFMQDIWRNKFHKFQILTIEDLLNGVRPHIPTMAMEAIHYKSSTGKDYKGDQEKIKGIS